MKKTQSTTVFARRYTQCLIAAACIAGACFSLMLNPVVNYSSANGSRVSGIILSIVTWALVLGAAVLVQRLCSFAAYQAAGDRGEAGTAYKTAKIGPLNFAANKEGLVAEILFAAGVILWLLRAFGVLHVAGPLRMLPYSLTFAGLLLHCFFNGKSYIYIKRKHSQSEKRGTHE